MGCPVQVCAAQILLPINSYKFRDRRSGCGGDYKTRHLKVPPGIFHSSIDVIREFLIDSNTVTPRLGPISIVEELVKARHLRRLQGLVRDECSLQGSKNRFENPKIHLSV